MKISKGKNEETNTYKLLGQDIETVTQVKDIGVIIDWAYIWKPPMWESQKSSFYICSNDFQVFR